MNDDLAQAALSAIQKLEADLAESRRLLAAAEDQLAKARAAQPTTLQDAIAKAMDPVARRVSKSRGTPSADSVRKSSEGPAAMSDMTYRNRAARKRRVAELEKRR